MPDSPFRAAAVAQSKRLIGLARWVPVAALVGLLAGTASALLIVSLDYATRLREQHVWLIWLLGPVGWVVGWLYERVGSSVAAGNNLILDQVHDPTAVIPLRMTPLILLATFLTHVFGGSAGREGTAVQTGASLADQLSRPFRMTAAERRILLMMGVSAGFASVFGTPLAGAIFGIEVLAVGTLSYEALGPCVVAAFAGNLVTRAWSVDHTAYRVDQVPALSVAGVAWSILAGILFGLMALVFARLAHAIGHFATKRIASPPTRPLLGGLAVTAAVFGLGTTHTLRYLGLGTPTIMAAFYAPQPWYDFAGKTIFTAVTLGMGFKGGEVTPLFFIGATMGNALAHFIPLPASLLAGMGFAAVFAGAANTPLASTFMAFELFGAEAGAYAGIACVMSYLFSGHSGIYSAQRMGRTKLLNRAALSLDHAAEPLAIEAKQQADAVPKI